MYSVSKSSVSYAVSMKYVKLIVILSSHIAMRCEVYSSNNLKCVSGPSTVLVHCSAGVGRSGTFIALYKLMTKIDVGEISHTIDILSEVFTLREDRCHMVKYFSKNLLKRDSLNLSRDSV